MEQSLLYVKYFNCEFYDSLEKRFREIESREFLRTNCYYCSYNLEKESVEFEILIQNQVISNLILQNSIID